jgi:hypothetical protein
VDRHSWKYPEPIISAVDMSRKDEYASKTDTLSEWGGVKGDPIRFPLSFNEFMQYSTIDEPLVIKLFRFEYSIS